MLSDFMFGWCLILFVFDCVCVGRSDVSGRGYREDVFVLEIEVGMRQQELERRLVPPERHLFCFYSGFVFFKDSFFSRFCLCRVSDVGTEEWGFQRRGFGAVGVRTKRGCRVGSRVY